MSGSHSPHQELLQKLSTHFQCNPEHKSVFDALLVSQNTTSPIIINSYLKARKNDVGKAFQLLVDSLQWRIDIKMHEITHESMKSVRDLRGSYVGGLSERGDSIVYIIPGMYNPHSADERINYLVYLMEEGLRLSCTKRMIWIMDFSMYGSRAKDKDSKKVAFQSIKILQGHYPETLEHLFVVDAPWFFRALWFVLKPFIDPVTKQKIHFISRSESDLMLKHIAPEMLDKDFGGKLQITDDMKADWRWIEEEISKERWQTLSHNAQQRSSESDSSAE